MTSISNPARRKFLKDSAAVTGGLVVGFHLPGASAQSGASAPTPEINAWVVVRPDDMIVIRYARSEMGQGSMTSAAQLVAEELEADWSKVRVEYASTNEQVRRKRAWGDMAAVGSRTIRQSQEYLRKGGATAREMLVAAAAQGWNVPASECVASNSAILHPASGRKTSFGSVALAAAKLEPPKDVVLKNPHSWKIAGKPIKRVDIPDTVMGRQRYGIDAQVPGMVYAAIAQCPVFGGKVKSLDAAKIRGRRGILRTLTIDDNAVVVVADNWWRAKEALKDVAIVWDDAGNGAVSSDSIMQFLQAGFDQPTVPIARQTGDVDKALAGAAKVIEAEYYTPFEAHATMEPQTCTVQIKDGKVDVWTSTQNAEATHATAAAVAGVPLENVYVHRMQLGGGFGRRGSQDYTRQATLIAKAMEGTPVKLLWTREEDMQHDLYRPASLIRLKGGLDAAGNPVALWTRVSAPSIIATLLKLPLKEGIDPQAVASLGDLPFGIPNVRVEYAQRNPHVPVGFWRTVGHSQNPFVRECFVDEMAHAAGKDPYAFRRAMLGGEHAKRDLAILDAVAKAAGWSNAPRAGVFRGIAETEAYGSYTACVAELSVNAKNEVAIHRIVVGLDCGHIVNPDNVVAQIQGSVVYALSALFWGDIKIKDGRVQQSNFHDYRLMRLAEMPKVEVVLAPTGGFWGGVGEPANAPVSPAVCNAIFAATGKRVRSQPLGQHGMSLVRA